MKLLAKSCKISGTQEFLLNEGSFWLPTLPPGKYVMRIGESGRGQTGSGNLHICVTASGTEHLNITVLMATRSYNFRVLFG